MPATTEVTLQDVQVQTLRGALHVLDDLIFNGYESDYRLFDPVRKHQYSALNSDLELFLQESAPGTDITLQLDATEIRCARDAIGTIQTLMGSDEGKETLFAIGMRPSGDDLAKADDMLGLFPIPRDYELARSDVNAHLNLPDSDDRDAAGAAQPYIRRFRQPRESVDRPEITFRDEIDHGVEQVRTPPFDSIHGCRDLYDSLVDAVTFFLRAHMAAQGDREYAADEFTAAVEDALDRAREYSDSNDAVSCIEEIDASRILLAWNQLTNEITAPQPREPALIRNGEKTISMIAWAVLRWDHRDNSPAY